MVVNGWQILVYAGLLPDLQALAKAADRASRADPAGYTSNASVRLYVAVSKIILEIVPSDPARPEYRLGNSLGPEFRSWFRVKFSGRFRLFFRYDSRTQAIVYAWINNEDTLRKAGARTDPYAVFRAKLSRADPPSDWSSLVQRSVAVPQALLQPDKPPRRR